MSYLSEIKSSPFNLIRFDKAKTWADDATEKLAQIDQAGGLNAAKASGLLDLIQASQPKAERRGSVGIIPIKGPIGKNLSKVDTILGAVDVNQVEADLEAFAADPSVKTILLDINSPGGTVAGVPELAARVREISQTKKVVSFSEFAASAAFWIGSQASEFIATPSASAIGSVGVFVPVLDRTGELKAKGISVEVIKSGKYKGQIPGLPLSDDARAAIQAEVIELHNEFKADVLAVRSRINPDDLEGQTFTGKRAAARGFVTGLVRNREELLARLGASDAQASRSAVKPAGALAAVEMPEGETETAEPTVEADPEADPEVESAGVPLSDRQTAIYSALETVVEKFGKFDQTDGPNGSHYMAENPFSARGIACENCPFYVGGGGCEIVDGEIAATAVCKFWIIPEGKLKAEETPADETPAAAPEPASEPSAE
jgi:signal peptide peptidase SppA